jgi:zinc finger-like protein
MNLTELLSPFVYVQVYFGMLDALLAAEELPEEYRDRCQVFKFFCSCFSLFLSAAQLQYLYLLHSSRIFFVMTVKEKGDLNFIGCTTNAAPVVLTIPESLRLIRQIVLHQTSEGKILSFV